ncbi:MAG: hypothetical protein E7657_07310, partial [Ruminococcaceae bacterium]|nr:hypothetical protein [Oscillospiraceae bacterium]
MNIKHTCLLFLSLLLVCTLAFAACDGDDTTVTEGVGNGTEESLETPATSETSESESTPSESEPVES